MLIEINDNKIIEDLQEAFSTGYPYLKIEFYKEPHHWYENSATASKLPPNAVIGEIRDRHEHGVVEIYSWLKAGDVEQVFRKRFDLNIQVYCLLNNEWIQTDKTDKLTLKELNDRGELLRSQNATNPIY